MYYFTITLKNPDNKIDLSVDKNWIKPLRKQYHQAGTYIVLTRYFQGGVPGTVNHFTES